MDICCHMPPETVTEPTCKHSLPYAWQQCTQCKAVPALHAPCGSVLMNGAAAQACWLLYGAIS